MYLTCCARTYINYSAFPLATNKCQAGWITRWNQDCWTNSNHLRYADDTTLMAESEEELKSLLIRVKVQFRSVAQPLWDPMHCSTPGFPIHHQLPELAQTHIHRVGDAIQPSHSLSSPSPPAFSLSEHQGLFKWVSSSHQVAKVLELLLQHQSFQWIFRTDFL